jgi:hypothetical protein
VSPEQLVAIIVALTGLLGAVLAVYRQVLSTHQLVNSRMTELLELTRTSAIAEGKLDQPGGSLPT